jgi:hypothetical protein
MVGFASRKLASGLPAEEVSLPTDLPTLRNASISWLLDAYRYFKNNPDVIKNAWASCRTKEWNLSYESLTSIAATERHRQLCQEDTNFALEFARFDLSAITGTAESDEEQHAAAFASHDDDLALSVDDVQARLDGTAMTDGQVGDDGEFLLSVEDAEGDFEDVDPEAEQSDHESESEVCSSLVTITSSQPMHTDTG